MLDNQAMQLRPRNLGELLDTAFGIYRSQFLTLVGIAAVLLVPLAIIQAVVSFYFGSILAGLSRISNQATPAPGQNPFDVLPFGELLVAYGLLILVAIVQGVVVNNLVAGALIRAVSQAYFGQPVDVLGAYRMSIARFPALALATIALGLALTIASVLLLGGCGFLLIVLQGGNFNTFDERSFGLAALMVLALAGIAFLVIVPLSLFVATRFLVAPQAIVLEEQGPLAGLGRSWRLVGRSFWRTLLVVVVLGLLLYMVASLPSGIVSFAVTLASRGDPAGMAASNGIATLVSSLGLILMYPLQYAVQTVHYYDLRTRSEGLDIELRTAALDARLGGQE